MQTDIRTEETVNIKAPLDGRSFEGLAGTLRTLDLEHPSDKAAYKMVVEMLRKASKTKVFKDYLYLDFNDVENVLKYYEVEPDISLFAQELSELTKDIFTEWDLESELLASGVAEDFFYNFKHAYPASKLTSNRLSDVFMGHLDSYAQLHSYDYRLYDTLEEAIDKLGAAYQEDWAKCLDYALKEDVYLFLRGWKIPDEGQKHDRDETASYSLLRILQPKKSLIFKEEGNWVRKIPLALALRFMRENSESPAGWPTIIDTVGSKEVDIAIDTTWALWRNAEQDMPYHDATTAFNAALAL